MRVGQREILTSVIAVSFGGCTATSETPHHERERAQAPSTSLIEVAALDLIQNATTSCPMMFDRGVLSLDWQPGFIHVDEYDDGEALTVSSFYNIARPPGSPPSFYARDRVARIPLDGIDPDTFDAATGVEDLTDRTLPPSAPFGVTVWPNEAVRAPDGMFPFEAVIVPQGFHPAMFPGRLTAVDVATGAEWIIHQSIQGMGPTYPLDPNNSPRFYHRALFADMNGDGLDDIVTVRSGFRVGAAFYPPFSELVVFFHPGDALAQHTPWPERVLWGGPAAGFLGPDIHLDMADLENDGVPEIVATHFFTGGSSGSGRIALYGAPVGGTWADVDALAFALPRVATLSADQGFPFDVQLVDLDRDGRLDVLASNHQPDGCTPQTSSAVPGRVFALEPPANGDLFGSPWTTHILLDGIRPNPTLPGAPAPGRLAPGRAQAFWPVRLASWLVKPWIVVGGDESSQVWVLRPRSNERGDWRYRAAVVFDVDATYGPGTTQTPLPGIGRAIGTVGGIGVRYDHPGPFGFAELYIAVFEAHDIHVMSLRPSFLGNDRIQCVEDAPAACSGP